jgi:hypothetical protein
VTNAVLQMEADHELKVLRVGIDPDAASHVVTED